MNRTRTLSLAVPFVGLALALSACGSSTQTASPAAQASVQGVSTEHNDVDAAFIRDMTPHHNGALAMAELAPTRASSPQVKAIAARILGEQQPEIARMMSMSQAWKVDLAGGASKGSPMGGAMGMDDDAKVLEGLTGPAFDKEFLTRMIAHHTSAVQMAGVELGGGKNPQAKQLGEQITAAQKAEITEMQALLAK